MDPLTALSLACNALQIIDFGATVIAKCKELYKHGALAENQEVESMARHLTNLATDLKLPESFSSAESVQQEDKDIWTLAQQCSETANELICELQKLGIQGTHRRRDAVRKAIKETWNQNPIESIQRRLEQYQRTLNTSILINLRQHARKVSTEQSKAFKDLDRKVQTFINAVAGDQEPFAALKELIQNENASCKQHVMLEAEKLRVQIARQDSYKNLLESLYFPDIHARQEGIEEAHEKTFGWIFEKPGDKFQPWHDFVHWLECGHGTYWISGKAGSGKSTLMNLICQDPLTNAALRVWSGTSEVLLPKFFFWNGGTELQKSSRGLLRSIIYQIMEKTPELMPVLERYMNTAQQRSQQLPTWTERRLLATLQHLLRHGLQFYRLCIFVDGLDEFSGHQDDLLELTRDFRQYSNIKICLSSRPYRSFQDEFGSSAMLKLQDLTEPDIRIYTSDKLERARWETLQTPTSSLRVGKIVDGIVRRAEGVFLWVKLAVRDQIDGIRNSDDADQLLERLRTLPDEIEGIYVHMLQRIDKVYRKEAAQYFHLVLNWPCASLFSIALAGYNQVDSILLSSSDVSLGDFCRHCRSTRERIARTCRGILEVRETHYLCSRHWYPFLKSPKNQNPPPERRNDVIELMNYQECHGVAFLHRTAQDFFKDNGQARKFLEASAYENRDFGVLNTKVCLADFVLFSSSRDDRLVRGDIERIMMITSLEEEKIGFAQPALMDLLDQSIAVFCQRSQGNPSNAHWCRTWGYSEDKSGDDGILNINPTDFLGFAAWYGLGLYVEYIVSKRGITNTQSYCGDESQSQRRTCSTVNYLLGCGLRGLSHYFKTAFICPKPVSGYLKLITALLKRGANPQMKYQEGTAWGSFLHKLHVYWFHGPNPLRGRQTEWEITLRAFLASGANPNERVYCRKQRKGFHEDPADVAVTLLRVGRYEFRLHLSLRIVLRLCFERGPNIIELEEFLTASGASLPLECTGVGVQIMDKTEWPCWLELTLSKKQVNDIIDVLERSPGKERWQRAQDHMMEVFQEMDLQQVYDQARREDELQKDIIQEGASGEDGLNTDIGNISDGWSIVASDSLDVEIE